MMAMKKCYQFIVKDEVQGVGLRLAIAKLISDELDVRADNLADGSVRVIVRGYKRDVMRFWEELRKHILGKAENPAFSGPAGITPMPIQTDRFFHKLQCEQMEKFVDVGMEMKSSIDEMSGKIDLMSGKIDNMSSGINSKLDSIDSKFDTLPRNMAKEIVKLKKNGFI